MAKVVALENLPEVRLLEDITRESAARLIEELSNFKGRPVALSIFSNGGDVHGSQAVAAYISNPANQMQVEVRVYGNAASGAMIIAAAAQKAFIASGAFALIHKARAVKDGEIVKDADLPKEEKAVLDAMNDEQVALFKKRTGMAPAAIEKLMDADRDMPAEEAVDKGFFDGIIPSALKLAAQKEAFKQIPSTMADEKKTVAFKVSAADALKAIASGEIHVPAEQVQTADATKVAERDARIAALEKELVELKTAKEASDAAKVTAETEKAAEVTAKAALDTELKAAKEAVGKYQAAIDALKKEPLKAQTLPDGTQVVIPGGDQEGKAQLTPIEQRIASANDAYEKFKQQRAAALKVA